MPQVCPGKVRTEQEAQTNINDHEETFWNGVADVGALSKSPLPSAARWRTQISYAALDGRTATPFHENALRKARSLAEGT